MQKVKSITYLLLGLIVGAAIPAVLAWVDPTAAPPAGNAPAPLNVSSTTQTKTGGVNFATTSGNVGIGTAIPTQKLDVTGNISATGTLVASGNPNGTDTGGSNCTLFTVPTAPTFVDLPGGTQCVPGTNPLDVTITVPANAKVLTMWSYSMHTADTLNAISSQILDNGGSAQIGACSVSIITAGERRSCTSFYVWSVSVGAHTFKVQVSGSAASPNQEVTLVSPRLTVVVLP